MFYSNKYNFVWYLVTVNIYIDIFLPSVIIFFFLNCNVSPKTYINFIVQERRVSNTWNRSLTIEISFFLSKKVQYKHVIVSATVIGSIPTRGEVLLLFINILNFFALVPKQSHQHAIII